MRVSSTRYCSLTSLAHSSAHLARLLWRMMHMHRQHCGRHAPRHACNAGVTPSQVVQSRNTAGVQPLRSRVPQQRADRARAQVHKDDCGQDAAVHGSHERAVFRGAAADGGAGQGRGSQVA